MLWLILFISWSETGSKRDYKEVTIGIKVSEVHVHAGRIMERKMVKEGDRGKGRETQRE